MEENVIRWFEIYVQDMERAKGFYEELFQYKLNKLDSPGLEMWAFPAEMNVPGAGGALVKMEGAPSGGNSTLVYFGTKDCSAEESRVEKAGGKVFRKKMSIGPHGFISLIVDTEGNMFGLHSMN